MTLGGPDGKGHLRFHITFASGDPAAAKDKLIAAGASLIVVTLRDPWSIPIQLAGRTTPMP